MRKKILCTILFFILLFIPDILLADTANEFSFVVVKCDPQDGVNTAAKCRNNYLNGSLDSYIVEENGDLVPGTGIMVVLKYKPSTQKNITALQAFYTYNTDAFIPLMNTDGTNILNNNNSNNLPQYYDEDSEEYIKSWSVEVNKTDLEIRTIASDLTYFIPLDSEVPLAFYFFRVKENAVPGSSAGFSFISGDSSTRCVNNNGDKMPVTTINSIFSIYGDQSRDTSLDTLTVSSGTSTYSLTPTFTPGDDTNVNYNTIVPSNKTTITLDATTNNENAVILSSGLGDKALNIGNNSFNIIVTSQFGDVQTYTINIYRLSNDYTLNSLTLSGLSLNESFSPTTYTYSVNAPYAVSNTVINGTATHANATIYYLGDWSLTNYGEIVNSKTIRVNAEDCREEYTSIPDNVCTYKDYVINVTRANPSANNYLSSLKVNGNLVNYFDKERIYYDIGNLSNSTESINIAATVEDTGKATVSGTGKVSLNLGNNTFDIVVTAEDGTPKTYQIKTRRLSSLVSLSGLSVTSSPAGSFTPSFTSAFHGDYTYSYPSNVESVTVSATATDTGNAYVSIIDSTSGSVTPSNNVLNTTTETFATPATRSITAFVTAEDGTLGYYTINVNRMPSVDADLKSLSLSEGTLSPAFSSSTILYTAEVGPNVTSVDVNAVVNSSFATYEVTGNTDLKFGNNVITITVTAEDGSDKSYIINLTRDKYADATLSDLTVNGVTISGFNSTQYSYDLENVSYDTTELNIEATATNEFSTVSGKGIKVLKTGINQITIEVVAQNEIDKQEYTINVTRNKNSDTGIKEVTVEGIAATYNDTTKNYEVTVGNSITKANSTNVVVDVNDPKLSIDAKSTVSMSETALLTTTSNTHNFVVTAEDGTIAQYTIIITREKSNIATLSGINVTNGSFSPSFSKDVHEYTVLVPIETTSVVVSATTTEEHATITGGTGSYPISEAKKIITIVVKSEDGNVTESYVLNIDRIKSSDNKLSSLTIKNGGNTYTLSPTFDPDTTSYTASVPGTIDKVTVNAILNDDRATLISGTGEQSLIIGSNTLTVRVKSESGAFLDYTIIVEREKKINNNLTSITVDGVRVSGFSASDLSYTLTPAQYSKSTIEVVAVTEDEDATVTGTGTLTMVTGDNTFNIVVSAQNGSKKTYVLNIYRALNNDTGIKSITVEGQNAILNTVTNKYEVTLPNSITKVNSSNVEVVVNDTILPIDPKSTVSMGETSLLTTRVNTHTITVTAEDGTLAQYAVLITREKSNIATLSSITVSNGSFSPSFNSETYEYVVLVPIETTSVIVEAVPSEEHAVIENGTGSFQLVEGTKTIEVVVKSENGEVSKTYKLNIERIKSSDNKLKTLSINHEGTPYDLAPTFNSNITNYTATVPGFVDSITINATKNDSRATIVSGVGTHGLTVGNNTLKVRVQSESGAFLDYTIVVERLKKANNYLSEITINGTKILGFDKETLPYVLDNCAYSVESIVIGATTEDTDATVSGIGSKNLATGENTFDIVVTAQNGDTRIYKITISRNKNNDATLRLLSVIGTTISPVFNKNTVEYSINVANAKESLTASDVTALATDANAIVTKQELVQLSTSETKEYIIQVTAEDGVTSKTYVINVTREKSSDATLSSVVLEGASLDPVFTPSTQEYAITVPADVSTFTINGIPTASASIVDGNGSYSANTNVVNLIVTSESGIVKTYTFNVIQALSNDASLNTLQVVGYSLNPTFASTSLSYTIGSIPYTTQNLKVNCSTTNASADVEYYVNSVKQSSNIVTIPDTEDTGMISVKVTAADGLTTKVYNVSYSKIYSSNAFLSNITSNSATIDFIKSKNLYTINVANDVNNISFTITAEDATAFISANGQTGYGSIIAVKNNLKNGTNQLEILVTAQDGQTKNTYTIEIIKTNETPSNNANLSALSIDGYSLSPVFRDDVLEYDIGQIPYSNETLTVNATTANGSAKLSYYVASIKQSSNVVTTPRDSGNKFIIVKVTAEDGTTTKEYKIKYSKTPSSNAYLSNLKVNAGQLNFSKTTLTYPLSLSNDVTSLDVTAILDDSKSTMVINGTTYTSPHTLKLTNLPLGPTNVIIVVTAEDGTIFTYTLNIVRESVSEKITSSIHTIEDGYIKTAKINKTTLDMKNELDNDNRYLEIWNATETEKLDDTALLATGQIVKLVRNNIELDRKVIVVKGDIDGSGEIDLYDAVKILNHYLERTELTGAYLVATDANSDDTTDLFDAVIILNHYLEKIYLYE